MKLPTRLQVELNSSYPRWPCYVHDGNGGFWKGFSSSLEMWSWLRKKGYNLSPPSISLEGTLTGN